MRKKKQLSLKQLSDKTGLSISFLSNYENGKVNISIASLIKIAAVLEVPVAQLLTEATNEDVLLVRKGARYTLPLMKTDAGTIDKDFIVRGTAPAMNVNVTRLPPHSTTGEPGYHSGEEFIYVLKGVATVLVGDINYLVLDGDLIYYSSLKPHMVANDQDGELEYLQVNTPPTF
jgi:transcriptional regulator with XRE-family HTH domain